MPSLYHLIAHFLVGIFIFKTLNISLFLFL